MKKIVIGSLIILTSFINFANASSVFYCPQSIHCTVKGDLSSCSPVSTEQPIPNATLKAASSDFAAGDYKLVGAVGQSVPSICISASCVYSNDGDFGNPQFTYTSADSNIVPDTDAGVTKYWGSAAFAACPVGVPGSSVQSNMCPFKQQTTVKR